MWSAVVCRFLATVGALSSFIRGSRILDAPTNLSIGFEDQYTAVVFWKFTVPEGENLSEMEFVLVLDGRNNSTLQFRITAWRRPFHYKFKYLRPNSKYVLKIWATSPTLGDGPPTEMSFTTMARDWPTPTMTNVTARRTWEAMLYTVSWELSRRPVELSHLDVVLCSPECETMRTSSSESDITFPISFYTEFSVHVIAFYDAGVAAIIARKSSEHQGMSEMGAPSKVQNITYIYQLGNKFRIDWLPSDPPNGPLNYHEVYIYDPNHPASISGVTVTNGLSANLFAPQLAGDLYKIQITAVNVDREGYHYRSKIAVFSHERILPSGSPTVEIIHRNWNNIHFKIIAEHPQEYLRFDVVSRETWIRVFNRPDEIKVNASEPYAVVPMELRTCYATSHLSIHTCGYFTHFNLTTNVKAPSGVNDLKISHTSHMRLIAEWNPPSIPNGPINGYVVNVTGVVREGKIGTKQRAGGQNLKFHLPSSNRRVEFRPPIHWRSLTLGVAAWNTDLDNSSVEYVGPTVYESLKIWEEETIELTPWHRFAAFWFFWLILFGCVAWILYQVFDYVVRPLMTGQPLALDVIQGALDALGGHQLDVDLLQGVPDRHRD